MGCQPITTCGIRMKDPEVSNSSINECEVFNTKFDKVLHLLKKLKTKSERYGDYASSNDLAWIIAALQERDLFDVEYACHYNNNNNSSNNNNNNSNNNNSDKDKVEFLKSYTSYQRNLTIKNDFKKVTTHNKVDPHSKTKTKYATFISKYKRSVAHILSSLENKENIVTKSLQPEDVSKIANVLSKLHTYEFNVFTLDEHAGKNTLYFVLNQSFIHFGLLRLINENKFCSFCQEIKDGYSRDVVYHNDLHGADVCQTTLVQLEVGNLITKLKLSDIDVIAVLTAAATHDYKHNGFNNNFHVNRGTDMAIMYNDNTVLENYHVSQTFQTLLKQDNNFLQDKTTPEEYRHIRRRMIDCILSTDMAKHAQQRSITSNLIAQYKINKGNGLDTLFVSDVNKTFDNQQVILSQLVHTSDLSNPAKMNEVFDKWTTLVYEEFFHQGDVERKLGMNISALCDRNNVKVCKSQVGFIQYVVMPQFDMMLEIIPGMMFYKEGILRNLERYKLKMEEEEKEKEETGPTVNNK